MTTPRKTVLAGRHETLDARMVDFHGWWMPLQYEGIVAEHRHTRTAASVFDVSHMGTLRLRGKHAAADLDRIVTRRVSDMRVGQCRYAMLLNEEGCIEDDLIVCRMGDDEYRLVVNAATIEKDARRVSERISAETEFENLSQRLATIALQGPRSRDVLTAVASDALSGLRYYHCTPCRAFGREMVVSRTGYTGELGYELSFDAPGAEDVWDGLLSLPDVKPAGLGARDTLRLEMGMPLYGADVTDAHTPLEAGLMFAVDMAKGFVGRDALARRQQEGPQEHRIGFKMEGRRAARPARAGR